MLQGRTVEKCGRNNSENKPEKSGYMLHVTNQSDLRENCDSKYVNQTEVEANPPIHPPNCIKMHSSGNYLYNMSLPGAPHDGGARCKDGGGAIL